MHFHSFILADDDTAWLKFLPAVVVGAIWLLGIGSAIFKRASQGQKTPIVPIAPFTGRPDAPASSRPVAARPARPIIAKAPRPVGRPGALAKMRTDALFAARQAEAIRQLVAGGKPPVPQRHKPTPPRRRPPAAEPVAPKRAEFVPTEAIHPPSLVEGRALSRRMQPALLRYQFILTEILRPPLALRDEAD